MAPSGTHFCDGSEQQIGPDRYGRWNSDTGDEQGRRQRSGPDTGDADEKSDNEAAGKDQAERICDQHVHRLASSSQ